MRSPSPEIAAALPVPDAALLAAARRAPPTRAEHDRVAAAVPALSSIELVPPPRPQPAGSRLTVAAFNVERGSHPAEVARLLAAAEADIALLTELDIGMARSGNRHTPAEIAAALDAGYAFAVEFVELGLGDPRERAWHAGSRNAVGLHGNAILSRHRLVDAAVVALDDGGLWFDGARNGERRIGGRIAVAARLADQPVWAASVHLESHSDAADRARQIDRLVAALDRASGQGVAVIGGDLNTSSLPAGTNALAAAFDDLAAVEPLFAVLRAGGFGWRAVNTPEATQRTRSDGTPRPPFRRLDWLAVRGLAGAAPRTVPAIDRAGRTISDHDMIVAEVALPRE